MYDKDGSGTIELNEMVEVLETVYVMEGITTGNMAQNRAKQIFQELDVNGDGTLTCDEFVKGCMKDEDMVALLQEKSPSITDEGANDDQEASGVSKSSRKKKKSNKHA